MLGSTWTCPGGSGSNPGTEEDPAGALPFASQDAVPEVIIPAAMAECLPPQAPLTGETCLPEERRGGAVRMHHPGIDALKAERAETELRMSRRASLAYPLLQCRWDTQYPTSAEQLFLSTWARVIMPTTRPSTVMPSA